MGVVNFQDRQFTEVGRPRGPNDSFHTGERTESTRYSRPEPWRWHHPLLRAYINRLDLFRSSANQNAGPTISHLVDQSIEIVDLDRLLSTSITQSGWSIARTR